MKAPQFRELRLKDIKSAAHNPPGRVAKDHIRDLVGSIGDVGLLHPILVTEENVIIDGHRRAAAYKELGYETIPAIVGRGDPNHLYASVNAASRKMGGNEALMVWLKQPEAVVPLLRARFDAMRQILGDDRVRSLAKHGYSIRMYNRARQICMYCDQDISKVPTIFDWLMRFPGVSTVLTAMEQGVSGDVLMRAVRQGRHLKLTAIVE